MKKENTIKNIIILIILFGLIFVMSSCGNKKTTNTESQNGGTQEGKNTGFVLRNNCKDLEILDTCPEYKGDGIGGIFKNGVQSIQALCDTNIDNTFNDQLENILNTDKIDINNIEANISKKEEKRNLGNGVGTYEIRTIKVKPIQTKKELTTINILYDLTYFTYRKETEKAVSKNRKENLYKFLNNLNVNYGAIVNLMYIGSTDAGNESEGHENFVIKSVDNFKLEKNTDVSYYLKYRCKKDSRKNVTTLFYDHIIEGEEKGLVGAEEKEKFIQNILAKIDEMYVAGKYDNGNFLVETLFNYQNFLNTKEKTQNVIFSDFRFQLHPEMKKNKKIPNGTNLWDFPPRNIEDYKDTKSDYSKLYKNTIPKDYLSDKCKNNEKLTLVGLGLDDNLDRQKVMKDYYKNYLFKGCELVIE